MNDTTIEWTDLSWNPVTGCSPVSEGCANCYARRMAQRLRGRFGYPTDEPFRVTLHPRLIEPYELRKPRRIFVCSMGDLFHEDVPDAFIAEVFGVMFAARQHIYQVLTKRPRRMLDFIARAWGRYMASRFPDNYPHVWLGVSVENQAAADERIPLLLQTPAAVRWVSVEPMLGPVDLTVVGPYIPPDRRSLTASLDSLTGGYWERRAGERFARKVADGPHLNWVICGGETGPGARPMHPDWVRSLRDQAVGAGVPFCFKAWGEWAPVGTGGTYPAPESLLSYDGELSPVYCGWGRDNPVKRFAQMEHVGRKAAGRLLDGRTWDEYPRSAHDGAHDAEGRSII